MGYQPISEREHIFDVYITKKEKIRVRTFKDLVNIRFYHASPENYHNCGGLLGAFTEGLDSPDQEHGTSVGRDGRTIIEDPIAFGMEWQVHPDHEPNLFKTNRHPVYPQQCLMPDPAVASRRRLGEATVTKAAAEAACADWEDNTREHCVYDVMSTGDLELAEAGSY